MCLWLNTMVEPISIICGTKSRSCLVREATVCMQAKMLICSSPNEKANACQ